MSFSSGITPVSSTPAKAMYDLATVGIAAQLTANSWTHIHQLVPADTNMSWMAANSVMEVWRSPNSTFYLGIWYSTASGGNTFNFYVSEGYNSTDHKLIAPIHGGTAWKAYTPGANGSHGNSTTEYVFNDAFATANVGYIVSYAPVGGAPYVLAVDNANFVYGCRVSNANYYVIAGEFTDLQTSSGAVPAVCLFGNTPLGASWGGTVAGIGGMSSDRVAGKVTREVGSAVGQSTMAAYHVDLDYPFPVATFGRNMTANASASWLGLGGIYGVDADAANLRSNRNHAGPIVATATLHSVSGITTSTYAQGTAVSVVAAMRGYLPKFIVGMYRDNGGPTNYFMEPPIPRTVSTADKTYYILGCCNMSYDLAASIYGDYLYVAVDDAF